MREKIEQRLDKCRRTKVIRMLDIFSGFLQFLKFDAVCIDNNVFRLHYKATVMVLVMASVLVTSRQYIGDPIDCLVDVSFKCRLF